MLGCCTKYYWLNLILNASFVSDSQPVGSSNPFPVGLSHTDRTSLVSHSQSVRPTNPFPAGLISY